MCFNSINIEYGAKVNIKDSKGETCLISNGYTYENHTDTNPNIYTTNLTNSGGFTPSGAVIDWDNFATPVIGDPKDKAVLDSASAQYDKMVSAQRLCPSGAPDAQHRESWGAE